MQEINGIYCEHESMSAALGGYAVYLTAEELHDVHITRHVHDEEQRHHVICDNTDDHLAT